VVARRHYVSAAHSKDLGELMKQIDADVSLRLRVASRCEPLDVRGRLSP
jgi:hypothetical protein